MACMVILFAMRTPYVPGWTGVLALGLTIGLTLILIAKRISWNMRRDHSSKIDTADFYSLPKIRA